MATLEELLALLPDNTTGAIDAADLRTIVTDLYTTSAALLDELSTLDSQVSEVTGQTAQNTANLSAVTGEVATLSTDFDGLQADLVAVHADITGLTTTTQDLSNAVGLLSSSLAASRSQITSLTARVTALENSEPPPVLPDPPFFTFTGTTFHPVVELSSGPAVDITWRTFDTTIVGTGPTPTITIAGSAAKTVTMEVLAAGVAAYDRVLTLNFGFDSTNDAGRYNIGPTFNKAAEPIVGAGGLGLLTGLRRFLAANTPLTGVLDLTGLAALEYVECFFAEITSVTLTGCTSLIRLCLEHCDISAIDLNPVAANLYDLRMAVQTAASTTFATMTAPLVHLYHYCTRANLVLNSVPLSRLPVIEQYWIWNTGQSVSERPISTLLTSFLAYDNTFNEASVDLILDGLDDNVTDDGTVRLQGSAGPSAAGQADADSLELKGWTVLIEPGSGSGTVPDPTAIFYDYFESISGLWYGDASLSVYDIAGGTLRLSPPNSAGYRRAAVRANVGENVSVRGTRLTNGAVDTGIFGIFARLVETPLTEGVRILHKADGTITVGSTAGSAVGDIALTHHTHPASWTMLRADLSGANIKVYLDATLVAEGTLPSAGGNALTGRQVGFLGEPDAMNQRWASLEVMNAAAPPPPLGAIIWEDLFQRPDATGAPAVGNGWNTSSTTNDLNIVSQHFCPSVNAGGTNVFRRFSTPGNGLIGDNCQITARIPLSRRQNGNYGIMARRGDSTGGVKVLFTTLLASGVRIGTADSGTSGNVTVTVGALPPRWNDNVELDFVVTLNGTSVTVDVDGTRVASGTMPSSDGGTSGRQVGFCGEPDPPSIPGMGLPYGGITVRSLP
jgi:hypothetical protein